MNKIAIAICGSSGIDYIYPNHGMKVFRSFVYIDEKEYIDYINITVDEFYHLIQQDPEVHSAQVSTGTLVAMFNELKTEGYTDVIAITISSGLSGTYQGICVAKDLIRGIRIHPFDSLIIGYPEAKMALIAKQMIDRGASVAQILQKLIEMRASQRLMIVVDNLKYLVKSGRLSTFSGLLGGLLKIKPCLGVNTEGKVVVEEKIRTKQKSIERIIARFLEEVKDKNIEPYMLYTSNYEEVASIRTQILLQTKQFSDIKLYAVPPVIGVHSGPGAFGIGYTIGDNDE